jgi:hypothetical protein
MTFLNKIIYLKQLLIINILIYQMSVLNVIFSFFKFKFFNSLLYFKISGLMYFAVAEQSLLELFEEIDNSFADPKSAIFILLFFNKMLLSNNDLK